MLLKCPRIKRVYLKLCTAVFIVVVVILYLRPYLSASSPQSAKLISKLAHLYEKSVKDYENKIIPNLGHNGQAAYLEGSDAKEGEKALKKIALNKVLSDRMPLDRKLRDPRNPKCKTFTYDPKLKASVIVIFFNELLSVILRTIWSVILQTPKHLLQEIILVDDASTEDSLKGLLDYYIETRLKHYDIKIIHLKSRLGLIRARLQGARIATGDVLIFLDAHCEATNTWVEPLLSRIEEDHTAVLVPIIDVIEADTLAYSTNGDTSYQVGGFSWSGHFTWIDIQDEEDKNKLTPVKSPTMAGGLFAIDRKFFWEIGSYDEQMDGWGGENLEMSFRIWQCGGRLETVPCSRVGHIFRDFHPYSFPDNKDTHGINTARLAHVWMDDYKRFFFMYQPGLENNPIVGDLTHRKQLRQKLRCKSFKWYLENVYPEKFVPDENVYAHGQVQNSYGMCLDDLQLGEDKVGPLGLYQCHPYLAMSQYFSLSNRGELRKENFCAETFGTREVQLTECHGHKREQFWVLYRNGTIFNPTSGKCLSSEGVENGKGVVVDNCKSNIFQRWRFTNIHRHGNRNPLQGYRNDPYGDESHWPEGFAQLTKEGIQSQYALGLWLRDRYDRFLPSRFSPTAIRAVSTDVDRTLMSAQSTMAGFFKPTESEKWSENVNWQPVPIHTAPLEEDPLLAMKKYCKRWQNLFDALQASKHIAGINEINRNLYDFLSEKTGENVTSVWEVETIYNTLDTQFLAGKVLPDWTTEVFPEKMKPAVMLRFKLPCYTKELTRFRVGLLFGQILENFRKFAGNSTEAGTKVLVYSVHDSTLVEYLMTIGAFNEEVPPYSSVLLIELYRDDEKDYVNIFFRNSTSPTGMFNVTLGNCDFDCDFRRFSQIFEPIAVYNLAQWIRECEN